MKYLFLILLAGNAQAASYTFHINNVEGNPNKPSVILPDDSKFTPLPVQENTNQIVSTASAKSEESIEEPNSDKARFPFRFSFMASRVKKNETESLDGANFSLSYSILKDFALAGFYGAHSGAQKSYGAEIELTPVRLTSFGWEDWIEVSALFGAMYDNQKNFAHAGARVNLNMGPRYGWNLSARTNLTDRSLMNYKQVDAGFHVRF